MALLDSCLRFKREGMMSRKDYIAIAQIISKLDLASFNREALVTGLIPLFAADNPLFDPEKFRAACEHKR